MPPKRSNHKPVSPPASPLNKGGQRGVAAPDAKLTSPLDKGGHRGVISRPSSLLDTRIIYCGDCLDQLRKLPDACPRSESGACVDLIYIDPPFNSNRNYEVFWGEVSEPRAQASGSSVSFEDRHASTQAYIEYMRPRCVELARALKNTGSFYYHCDWLRSDSFVIFNDRVDNRLKPGVPMFAIGR